MNIARFKENDFKVQTVKEHTQNVANFCKKFGEKLNVPSFLYLAGLLHDMGKYSNKFQRYIKMELSKAKNGAKEETGEVADKEDHGVFGGKYIYERYSKLDPISCITSEMLALICCYHHGGLPDCVNSKMEITLLERFNKIDPNDLHEVYKKYINDININIDEIFDDACSEIKLIIEKFRTFNDETFFALHLFIKTAYSMLIDADRYDSYLFELDSYDEEINNKDNMKVWQEFSLRLEERLAAFNQNADINENKKKINKIRQDISDECLNFAYNNEGIYTLTVPTGGGKTLSSLRLALKHAEMKNKDRIIYILPYTTIIEQNAEEVRKSLRCGKDLLEYHSNVLEDDKSENYKLLTHRWCNRIIYTTMVQFLNTFYNKGTQDMRRIHNLLNSIIIFDEIQTIPIKCVDLFNSCINYLNKAGNSTVILCSATQPELNKANVSIRFTKPAEIINNVDNKFKILERVEVLDYTRKEGYTYEEASSFIFDIKKSSRSVLMVCNTVNSASTIYNQLSNIIDKNIDLYFLSSNLCPTHRKDIIAQIKESLKKKNHLICISTQLIEAGVDISFETTIRALAGLDSIAQTSGRGNRNGEAIKGFSYIINVKDDDELIKLTEIRLGKTHCKELLDSFKGNNNIFDNSLLSPKSIKQYYEYYYSDLSLSNKMRYPVKNTSIYDMLDYNESNLNGFEDDFPLQFRYKFKSAGELFKVIDNDTKTILVSYKKGKDLIAELLSNNSYSKKKKLLDELGQYSVNIYTNKFEALKKEEGIIFNKDYGVYILKDFYYDKVKGVSLKKNLEFLNYDKF